MLPKDMYGPRGVALDAAGNLYIADHYNNRIRRVDGNGIITTVAGRNGGGYSGDGGAATSAWMKGPQGACLDAAGNLYIADTGNNRVRKVGTNGVITTVAGKTGAATNANLDAPCFVGLDAVGNMYITDYWNNRVAGWTATASSPPRRAMVVQPTQET
ncbi:MAG: hypothetical protein NT154_35075 [Verrucomicrobia bacterium]|nr:hypothetical protein [Verrucomicrobiota bacterium]